MKSTRYILDSSLAFLAGALNRLVMMSAEEKRQMQQRAVGVACAAAAAAYGAPQITAHVSVQKTEEVFLGQANELAQLINTSADGQIDIEGIDISKPWRQQVAYASDSEIVPGSLTKASFDVEKIDPVVDVIANFSPRKQIEEVREQRLEHLCLAEAIYYEARSEELGGQLAVAEVVENRVASDRYPDTVCDVVYQGHTRVTGCQFSFTCDGSLRRKPRGEAWDRSIEVAAFVMMGLSDKTMTGNATHYHTDYVTPYWRSSLIHTETIGTHIFYRIPEAEEWRTVRTQQAKANGLRGIQKVSNVVTSDDLNKAAEKAL
ncbi:cell wall hydrolase [Hirschia baltica]|uniref:Cell wall hydrolase SleB n=1 Tax=Hirschia baltica (strain ATCC 49814 / DSM 5838 / IFAM 1418) TaxID=582402 RepID=C6XRI8_HIRBI|nr:cell wall hydrolase [Hirschia baltica]ACT58820.1 cell wall hydrolase SleB [Hirschia baltica ATCC 49814]